MKFVRQGLLRPAAATVLLLAGALFFLGFAEQHYPLKHWLFLRYLWGWLYALLFLAGSLAAGWRLLDRVVASWLPRGERFVLAMALGVLAFFGGIFVAGLLDLYGILFFFGWPMALVAYGGPKLARDVWPMWREWRQRGLRAFLPSNLTQLGAALLLLLGVVAVYLQVMTPLNLCADSYWYHMPMAEYYAQVGGLRRFDEGWYLGAYPQLATILYTWAFLAPGQLFDHVLTCVHVEFVLFLITLVGISVLSGRLLGQRPMPWAAAAFFLFPKVLVYDSNLNGGADHVLAFWTPALGLAFVRLAERFGTREAILAALVTSGAVLTKYQASMLVIPAGAFILLLAARWRQIGPVFVWGTVCLLATAPHWLKNIVYYHDPFYPLLHSVLPSTPFYSGAAEVLENVFWPGRFLPHGPLAMRLEDTARVLATFSFIPNDWGFHGDWPVFGSVLTLLVPALWFLRAPRRLWVMVLGVHAGIAVWYMSVHEDRFLQALVPWMAAATACAISLAWRMPLAVKGAVASLVGAQVVWGADAYFIRCHAMNGDSPIRVLAEYLGAAQKGDYEGRYAFPSSFEKLGKRLPKNAKVIPHQTNNRLGLAAAFSTDSTGWQGGIEYLDSDSPDAASSLWRQYGVTHLFWQPQRDVQGAPELAREVVFARTAAQYLDPSSSKDPWQLGTVRAAPRDAKLASEKTQFVYLGCDGGPASGLYTAREFANERPHVLVSRELAALARSEPLATANSVLARPACHSRQQVEQVLGGGFSLVLQGNDFHIWVRTAAR